MDLGEAGNRAIWQVCGGNPRDRRLRRGYTHSPCPRDPHYVVWGDVLVGRGVGGVGDGTGGGSWSARKSQGDVLSARTVHRRGQSKNSTFAYHKVENEQPSVWLLLCALSTLDSRSSPLTLAVAALQTKPLTSERARLSGPLVTASPPHTTQP
jgi:hypothetical protein